MSKLYAQHGPAKGQKITNALEENRIYGVIFSPREEHIHSLFKYIDNTDKLDKSNCFYDPQFYYSMYNENLLKKLENVELFPKNVERKDWRRKSERLLNYFDKHVEVSSLISNSIIVPGFHIDKLDWKFDYSVDIYSYFYKKYNNRELYLSLLLSANIFFSKKEVDEILDEVINSIPVEERYGIYLTICYDENKSSNYEDIDSEVLANILYFIHALKKENFKIIVGYTFLNSLLFSMLDCEIIASGWFNTLRKFSKDRFDIVDSFGRRKKRYTSIPLVTNITLDLLNEIELETLETCLAGTTYDNILMNDLDSLSFSDLEQQYWEAISKEINNINNVTDKISYVENLLENALLIYDRILFENKEKKEFCSKIKKISSHLETWIIAIGLFKRKIAIY